MLARKQDGEVSKQSLSACLEKELDATYDGSLYTKRQILAGIIVDLALLGDYKYTALVLDRTEGKAIERVKSEHTIRAYRPGTDDPEQWLKASLSTRPAPQLGVPGESPEQSDL